jgi:hypothetical protein
MGSWKKKIFKPILKNKWRVIKQSTILFLFLLLACSNKKRQEYSSEICDSACIVIYGPDAEELKKIKMDYASIDYSELLGLNVNVQQRAIKEAEKRNLKRIISDKHIYTFKKKNGQSIQINRDTQPSKWGLILFDVKKEPILKTGTEPELDIKQYFDTK